MKSPSPAIRSIALAAMAAWLAVVPVRAADAIDPLANALRDAQKLADCMASFDGKCTVEHTYVKVFEQNGLTLEEATQKMIDLYDRAKSAGLPTPKYVLTKPLETMPGDGRLYVFVPYILTAEDADKQKVRVRAYFIGISTDNGASWQFLDGLNKTPETIKTIMPSYSGQKLPPVGPLPAAQ